MGWQLLWKLGFERMMESQMMMHPEMVVNNELAYSNRAEEVHIASVEILVEDMEDMDS